MLFILQGASVQAVDRCSAFFASHTEEMAPSNSLQDLQTKFKNIFSKSSNGEVKFKLNTQDDYAKARSFLKNYGVERFHSDMINFGIFGNDGKILPTTKPFNVFARIISGDLPVPYGNILENLAVRFDDYKLSDASKHFMVAKNLPEHDQNWNNYEKASQGNASMSLRHRFLIPRDPKWSNFNVLTIGLTNDVHSLRSGIEYLKYMKKTAQDFVERERQLYDQDPNQAWSSNVGFYFHCFPFNSVQYLHLHIVDLNHTGPAFNYMQFKNLSIDSIIKQLEGELAGLEKP